MLVLFFPLILLTSTYTKLIDYNGANGANPYFGSGFIEVKGMYCRYNLLPRCRWRWLWQPGQFFKACTQPAGYVKNNTDCDDTKASVHPGRQKFVATVLMITVTGR